jgi:plastocyanin domain-containing protein
MYVAHTMPVATATSVIAYKGIKVAIVEVGFTVGTSMQWLVVAACSLCTGVGSSC